MAGIDLKPRAQGPVVIAAYRWKLCHN